MKYKNLKYRKTILFCAIVFLITIANISVDKIRLSQTRDLLARHGGYVYASDFCLYQFDVEKGLWNIIADNIGVRYGLAFGLEKMVYFDYSEYKLKICPIGRIEESVVVETMIDLSETIRCKLAFSNDDRFIACMMMDGSLTVLDLETKSEEFFEKIPDAYDICWSCDNKGLIISSSSQDSQCSQILWLDVKDKSIRTLAKGGRGRVAGADEIAFWRDTDGSGICYKMNILSGEEREVFRSSYLYYKAEWNPSGRFLALCRPAASMVTARLFSKPYIWDSKEQQMYYLPKITATKYARTYWVGRN